MTRQEEWTRETEAEALAELRRATGPEPVLLVYTRQSVSDFDDDGAPRGPSLDQQIDAVTHRPELHGLPFELFEEPDRSGKETSRRPKYLAMMESIRAAPPGAIRAVAFYDQDRLHRNDVEFFSFMAEMTERRILVFDTNGLISNADRLSWKIKAVVAQEEREKVARRVRDNLSFLKRNGNLLGVIPQGYRRVDGKIVEDPEAGPIIRDIFKLYATGRYSVRSLADHLNSHGIRPARGPGKANHNRPAAVIFTGDVIKDILKNPSYRGKVVINGELIEGKHPPLIDEETWEACIQVRARNQRRTNKHWTRHTYPLTPLLRCGLCGDPMFGKTATNRGRTYLYYACRNAERSRSAVAPRLPSCRAKLIKAHILEDGIREELRRCLPTHELHQEYRDELWEAVSRARRPETLMENAIHRLEGQLDRARRLFELGEYDEETFLLKRSAIRREQDRLQEEMSSFEGQNDAEWCRVQLFDLLAAWDAADGAQRTRLLAGLFEHIEARADSASGVHVVAVPRLGWRPFFERVLPLERETGFEPATSTLARSRSTE